MIGRLLNVSVHRVKMYKTKLKDWGFEKNIRNDQANFMYRKARKRMAEDGKKIVFHINGVQVPPGKVERLLKSNRQNLGSTTGSKSFFQFS